MPPQLPPDYRQEEEEHSKRLKAILDESNLVIKFLDPLVKYVEGLSPLGLIAALGALLFFQLYVLLVALLTPGNLAPLLSLEKYFLPLTGAVLLTFLYRQRELREERIIRQLKATRERSAIERDAQNQKLSTRIENERLLTEAKQNDLDTVRQQQTNRLRELIKLRAEPGLGEEDKKELSKVIQQDIRELAEPQSAKALPAPDEND